jgi:UPF0716 protein FxsA
VGLLLVVLFLVVPIVEIAVIVQVGQVIGAWPTVLLLVLESLLGAWLIKREGGRAWESLRTAGATGRLPSRELADAGLILVGGTLLLTPGFITDVFGLVLLLPPTRAVIRGGLGRVLGRRFQLVSGPAGWGYARARGGAGGRPADPYGRRPGPYDVEGTAQEVDEGPPPAVDPPDRNPPPSRP